jgi:NADH-quinone oxidoreductase subunit M
LLLEMGMFGVFMALDLVLFYVFWEIGLVPMYFLIGIWGQPKDRPQYSAIKFFLYTLAGSRLHAAGHPGHLLHDGTFDIVAGPGAQALGPCSAATRCSPGWPSGPFSWPLPSRCRAWPFHTWLPDAHTAAPTAG